jgi:hypothetical protein
MLVWLLPKIWRGIAAVARAVRRLVGGRPPSVPEARAMAADGAAPGGFTLSLRERTGGDPPVD